MIAWWGEIGGPSYNYAEQQNRVHACMSPTHSPWFLVGLKGKDSLWSCTNMYAHSCAVHASAEELRVQWIEWEKEEEQIRTLWSANLYNKTLPQLRAHTHGMQIKVTHDHFLCNLCPNCPSQFTNVLQGKVYMQWTISLNQILPKPHTHLRASAPPNFDRISSWHNQVSYPPNLVLNSESACWLL